MKAGLALWNHSARRARPLILVAACLLAGFQVLFVLAARSIQEFSMFDRLAALVPDVMRQLLGPSFLSILSFQGIVCLGYFHVAVIAVLVGLTIAIATEPAAEVETRMLDLILAHPLARHWVITRTILLLAASIALVVIAMMAGTRAGLFWWIPEKDARAAFGVIPLLSLNLGLLLLCWGAIGLVFASMAHRRSTASAITSLLAAVAYLVDVISQVWSPLRPPARFSPFHYYNSLRLILGSADATHDILILAGTAVAAFLLAYFLFSRRDL
jgi:beta-exotoxin I transport system permease protein